MKGIDYSLLPKRRPGRVGEAHTNAKITDDIVREIRRLYSVEGIGTPRIARAVGLSTTQVQRIVKGTAWSHVV